jgi:hypothetical protein
VISITYVRVSGRKSRAADANVLDLVDCTPVGRDPTGGILSTGGILHANSMIAKDCGQVILDFKPSNTE